MLYAAAALGLLSCASVKLHGEDVHLLTVERAPDDENGKAFKKDIEAAIDEGWRKTPKEAAEFGATIVQDVEAELDAEGLEAARKKIESLEADRDDLNSKLNDAEKTNGIQERQIAKLQKDLKAATDDKPKKPAPKKDK